MAFEIAEKIVKLSDKYQIPYIFKGSFKKANRSRVDSFTGIGDEKALEIIKKVGAVSYTHLDVYKRQLLSRHKNRWKSLNVKKLLLMSILVKFW